jgi:hypothetical protein
MCPIVAGPRECAEAATLATCRGLEPGWQPARIISSLHCGSLAATLLRALSQIFPDKFRSQIAKVAGKFLPGEGTFATFQGENFCGHQRCSLTCPR